MSESRKLQVDSALVFTQVLTVNNVVIKVRPRNVIQAHRVLHGQYKTVRVSVTNRKLFAEYTFKVCLRGNTTGFKKLFWGAMLIRWGVVTPKIFRLVMLGHHAKFSSCSYNGWSVEAPDNLKN